MPAPLPHPLSLRSRVVLVCGCGALAAGLTAGLAVAQEPPAAFAAAHLPPATRGPVRVAFTPDGTRALVPESDGAALAVIDRASGKLLREIPTGGQQPGAAAADSDTTAVVVNSFSGSIVRLSLSDGKQLSFLPLRGEPAGIALSTDRRRAFVSLAELNQVAVLDLPELKLRARVPVGARPRELAMTPDGRTLLAANFQEGSLSLIDSGGLRETRRVALPGINLRGLALPPDGRTAWVTGQVPAQTRVTWVAMDVWVNSLFRVELGETGADAVTQGRLDFVNAPAPDPEGLVVLPGGRVALTASGSDEALLVRTPEPARGYYEPVVERRSAVGAHPRGLALSPDGKELWVANELGNSISVLAADSLAPLRRIDLPVPAKRDLRLPGRYLFSNAGMTAGRQFTCNSCHPGGGADGLAWQFVHVPDGLPVRNTRNLRGGITATSPYRWSGREDDIEVFMQDEITGLLHGPTQPHDTLHHLWNLLDRFPMPPNPYRTADGRFTPEAVRGKLLFEGKAGCASCHDGELAGGSGKKASIGTTEIPLDVPHLHGVFDSAPYLHDGRAKTLEEVFTRWNPDHRHGKAERLTPSEMGELLQYVREL